MREEDQKNTRFTLLSGIFFAAATVIEMAVWARTRQWFSLLAGIIFAAAAILQIVNWRRRTRSAQS